MRPAQAHILHLLVRHFRIADNRIGIIPLFRHFKIADDGDFCAFVGEVVRELAFLGKFKGKPLRATSERD